MAIWGLAGNRVVVPPDVIESLIGNVKTNASGSGAISGWALGALRQDAEHAIPALIDGLNSKDTGTRWGSAYGLRLWGTNAVSAIPALTAQLADPDQTIRNYAKTALKEIRPKQAARANEP
jgi:HEAT repeat protein